MFIDYDGQPDLYVVEFPGGRIFCCKATDVEPDAHVEAPRRRHHRS